MSGRQLALTFPAVPSYAAADFISSGSTHAAESWLAAWPNWPAGRLVLVGPEASGKSHLGAIWCARSQAVLVPAARLRVGEVASCLGAAAHVLVEDAERAAGDPERERALLHLVNLIAEHGGTVLLTARTPPMGWPVSLPDLRSRLVASGSAAIGPPDEPLLAAVLAKQLADRQIACDHALLNSLVARLPRSFAAVAHAASLLDALALAEGRRISRAQAARVVSALTED